jgi:hypothetical protein
MNLNTDTEMGISYSKSIYECICVKVHGHIHAHVYCCVLGHPSVLFYVHVHAWILDFQDMDVAIAISICTALTNIITKLSLLKAFKRDSKSPNEKIS